MKRYEVTFRAQGRREDIDICVTIVPHKILTDEQQIAVGLHFYVGVLVRIVSIKQV